MNTQGFELDTYTVFSGDLRVHFPAWLAARRYSGIVILADDNTARHCLPAFLEKTGLPAGLPLCVIPAGEQHKNLATCERIWQSFFQAQLDRRALAINLGGGVIGDMGGFCAATFKRGIDFVQVPTTLLSATDASVGGKLGIDFQGIKNAVGVFRDPAAVFIDPAFLDTLPEREWRSGFAEVIKHAQIGAPELWRRIVGWQQAGYKLPPKEQWETMLHDSISVKVRVVQEDPLEKGLRALLNFGHTIGHAVESYFLETNNPLTHGEAIALGMIAEARETWGPGERLDDLTAVIRHFYTLPILPERIFDELWRLMQQDKKNVSGAVRFAVPGKEPFETRVSEPDRERVREAMSALTQGTGLFE